MPSGELVGTTLKFTGREVTDGHSHFSNTAVVVVVDAFVVVVAAAIVVVAVVTTTTMALPLPPSP